MKILATYNGKKGYIVAVLGDSGYMVINESILQIPLAEIKIIDEQYE